MGGAPILERLEISGGKKHMSTAVEAISDSGVAAAVHAEIAARVYARDRFYSRPLERSVHAELARPQFRSQFLVSRAGGVARACVMARVSPYMKDGAGMPIGLLSSFEAQDDPCSTELLFREALRVLGDEGIRTVIGPLAGDTWHSYRLNIGPWHDTPFLMEPYNPPNYPELWENAGFRVRERYHSKRVDDVAGLAETLQPKFQKAIDAGYRFEPFARPRFCAELDRIYALSSVAFRNNPFYTRLSRAEFVQLYSGAERFIDPELVQFAVGPDGDDAGFVFSTPDWFRALAAMRGSSGPLASLRFWWQQRTADAVNVKTLAVVPEHRRAGLGAALMYLGYRAAAQRGWSHVNLCLMHDDNVSSRLDGGAGIVFRRYHLYERNGSMT